MSDIKFFWWRCQECGERCAMAHPPSDFYEGPPYLCPWGTEDTARWIRGSKPEWAKDEEPKA